jgi:hypothetical protein
MHIFLKYFLHCFLCMDNLNISYLLRQILMKMRTLIPEAIGNNLLCGGLFLYEIFNKIFEY